MKHFLPLLLLTLTSSGFVWPQTANDLNEGARLTHDSVNDTWLFSWWGHVDRTYFIEQSEDLIHWRYAPVVEPGQDAVSLWGFAGNADRLFVRLHYTDVATSEPLTDDFDGDSIPNINELTAPPQLNLDPFNPDSNGNGVMDGLEDTDGDSMLNGEELVNGLDPLTDDSVADQDKDGSLNRNELSLNTNPLKKDHPALKLRLY